MKLDELKADVFKGYNDKQIKAFLESVGVDPNKDSFTDKQVEDLRLVRSWLDDGLCQGWDQVADRWNRYRTGELKEEAPQTIKVNPNGNGHHANAITAMADTSEGLSDEVVKEMASVAGVVPQKMAATLEHMTVSRVAQKIANGELDRRIEEVRAKGLGKYQSPLMIELDNIISGSQPKQIEGSNQQ